MRNQMEQFPVPYPVPKSRSADCLKLFGLHMGPFGLIQSRLSLDNAASLNVKGRHKATALTISNQPPIAAESGRRGESAVQENPLPLATQTNFLTSSLSLFCPRSQRVARRFIACKSNLLYCCFGTRDAFDRINLTISPAGLGPPVNWNQIWRREEWWLHFIGESQERPVANY